MSIIPAFGSQLPIEFKDGRPRVGDGGKLAAFEVDLHAECSDSGLNAVD